MLDPKQTSYCKVGIFMLYILISSTNGLLKSKCKTSRDCNKSDKIICSVCAEDGSDKTAYCVYPYTYIFEEGTCIKSNKCENDCNKQGKCVKLNDDPPFCKCKYSFHGAACETKATEEPAYEVEELRWLFISEMEPNRYYFLNIKLTYTNVPGGDVTQNVYFVVETQDGYFDRFVAEIAKPDKKKCYSDKRVCYFEPNVNVRFPFRGPNNKVLTYGDTTLGFIGTYSIYVFIFGKVSYVNTLTTFVSYKGVFLKCVPMIKLSNCAPAGLFPSIINRSTRLQIDSSVSFLEDGSYLSTAKFKAECANSAQYKWTIYLFNKNNNANIKPLLRIYDNKALIFNPYSLDFGLYKVILDVNVVLEGGTSKNNAYCYFRVASLPLVALIDGGSDRKAFKKYGLNLSAERSRDPNMPSSQQEHVYLEWSCVRENDPRVQDDVCRARRFEVREVYRIHAEQLSYGAVYRFTLKVGVKSTDKYKACEDCDIRPKYGHVRVEVGAENDTTPDFIVKCALNCGTLVAANQKLFLKAYVQYEAQETYTFKWTYLKIGDKKEKAVDNIIVEGLPSYMLLVKEDTFEEGVAYSITTNVEGTEWVSKYNFQTENMIYEGNCDVQPTSGIKGETEFNINCTLFQNSTFTYEFYDKTEEEAKENLIFSGRMLGTSNSGRLRTTRLTRGTVCVYILDNNGLNMKRVKSIKLVDKTVTEEMMQVIQDNLTEIIHLGDISNSLRFISFISDIVPLDYDKNEVFSTLLNSITRLHLDSLADVKLCSSTLSNILKTLNYPKQMSMKPSLMAYTLRVVRRMSLILSNKVHDREQSQYVSPKEVGMVAKGLLNCLHATLMCNDTATKGVDEDRLDLPVLYKLRYGAESAEKTVDLVKDVMTYLQAPGQPPTKLAAQDDAFLVWVMKNDDGFSLQQLIEMDKTLPLRIPNLLQKRLEENTRFQDQLALQVVTIKENMFWWRLSDVKSNLVSVSVAEQVKGVGLIKVEDVSPSLGVLFKMPDDLNSTTIKSSVIQPDPDSDPNSLDMAVKIHRLDPAPGSFISITFLYPQTNNTLKVLLMADFTPDYEMVKNSSQSVLITSNSNVYPYIHRHREEPTFFYLAILPGPGVLINAIVGYEFDVNTTLCQFWASGQWSSSGCQVGKDTKGKEVHCECSHLSIFAAAFPVPPQDIDLFVDAKLFLTVRDNPLVVAFVSSILLLYIIIILFIFYKDRTEKYKKAVVILEDNFPGDTQPYLVAVYTSSRFNAGTTASIALKIFGVTSNSRVHVLSCRYRKVLRKNSDDWFLLLCPKPLGEITSLHIWHDNSGSSPDWFCEKIFVYDLKENVETLFVVEQWLALRLNNYPEAKLMPARSLDVLNVKRLFLENFVLGMMEGHILLGIFLRHPRSDVSRLQRISVFMSCLMTAMLCSIMFYKPSSDDRTGVDDFQYSIGSRELIISLQCLLITGVVTFIILFSFRKVCKHKYTRNRSTLHLREDELFHSFGAEPQSSHFIDQARKKNTLYRYFVKSVTRMMKAQPFIPVQMQGSEPVVEISKIWFITAWTTCIVVIVVCSYLVMLYGLKMGPVNSFKWLSAVVLTISEDIFVTGPARIVFYAMMLSMAFQRMFVVDSHRVSQRDVSLSMFPHDAEYFMKLLARRSHPMYAPLKDAVRREMLRKQEIWKKWWILVDFIISIAFVVAVSLVIFWLWSSHYYATSHVKNMITYTRVPYLTPIDFFKVKSIPEMNAYLQNSLTLALFQKAWDSKLSIDKDKSARVKYWAADHVSKMIGLPTVRQLRVNAETCENIVLSRGKCLPHWTYSNQDTDEYGPRWSVASWEDASNNVSAWKYTTRNPIPGMLIIFDRMYGATGRLYDASGYLVTLGPRQENAETTLTELRINNWQDLRTRVLFVELTVYNPNWRLLSQATLIAEYLVSGTILHMADVETIDANVNLGLGSLVFVGFIIWYLFRNGYLINEMGLLEYLSGFNNVCRLAIVAAGFISITTYFIHLYYSAQYFKSFLNSGLDTYFDYDAYSYYFILTKIILSILISIAFIRMILLIRCGRLLLSQYYTFLISLNWILWLTMIVICFIVVLRQFAYLLNIVNMTRVKELVINKNSMEQLTNEDFRRTEIQVFLYLKTVLISVFMSFYVILFMYFAKLARSYKIKDSDKFNYFTFLLNQLHRRDN